MSRTVKPGRVIAYLSRITDHSHDVWMLGKEVCNKRLMPSWIFPTLSHKIEVYTGREPVASQPFSIFEVKCAVKGGGKEPVETCCWEILLTSCAPSF